MDSFAHCEIAKIPIVLVFILFSLFRGIEIITRGTGNLDASTLDSSYKTHFGDLEHF